MQQSAKRTRILDTAQMLFLLQGLRGTSMEAIAEQAGVAKPTLYKYFADKLAVFDALVDRIIVDIRNAVSAALAGPGGAPERVAAALSAKHKIIFRLLENSPHAEELYFAPKAGNPAALEALDDWVLEQTAAAYAAEGRSDAQALARLVMAAADGISRHAKHAAEVGPAVRIAVARLSVPET